MKPDKEPQLPSGFIPILQRETIEELRRQLNLDYTQSAVKSGKSPFRLVGELAFDVFDKINSMGGDGLLRRYLIH